MATVITHAPIAEEAGARSQIICWVAGIFVGIVTIIMAFVPDLLYYLPRSVLAAIVLNACIGLYVVSMCVFTFLFVYARSVCKCALCWRVCVCMI